MTRKSTRERPVESPIAFKPCSNGEYCPTPPDERDRRAERLFREIVEEKSRRLGMTRRAFAESACGAVAALYVINQVYGCGDDGGGGDAGTGDGGGGRDVGVDAPGFDAPPDAMDDAGMACEVLAGDEFIFDVQTHPPSPLTPWRDEPLPSDAEDYIRMIFVGSDTSVACLSGIPSVRGLGAENPEANEMLDEIIDRIGGPRLRYHVNVDPPRGLTELDYMAEAASRFEVAAWKVYPHVGSWRLDAEESGLPFIAKARELGIRIIAAHRGIGADAGRYDQASSPIDLVRAARMNPDVTFLTYHSGWEFTVDENHPFDPAETNPSGIDRLIKAVRDEGIGPTGNVYAELGSTWRGLMTQPAAAAHAIGKLLLHLGEDRIVWGTDSVFTGSPQEQIVAFRTFQIPDSMQEMHGYPALTDAIRAKIFGLNAAAAYGVSPDDVKCVIGEDFVEQLRMARREDPSEVPVPAEKRYGPRTRREFLAFRRWERQHGHG